MALLTESIKFPNSIDTRFRLGSMNKMFTAVAVLQLASAGQLKLDELVIKYLPKYPNCGLASKVTISELLSHTGGIGDFFGPDLESNRLKLREHEDYIRLFWCSPRQIRAGNQI